MFHDFFKRRDKYKTEHRSVCKRRDLRKYKGKPHSLEKTKKSAFIVKYIGTRKSAYNQLFIF